MNNSIKLAALLGATAVAIGAFGAHTLKDYLLEMDKLDTFQTAVQYHFYHTLALLGIGILRDRHENIWLKRAAFAMSLGILLFSGSLYLICMLEVSIICVFTPLGVVALIAGWCMLFLSCIKKADS